jgi:D-lactate dehydrogenase
MSTVNVYDTKPYDREHLQAAGAGKVDWRFFEFRLTPESATTARGVDSVCVFVNDELSRPCLETLAACGVKHIALRCAGYNNVDLAAAKDFTLAVTRVPAYSPYAVAEHAVASLLTLIRQTHRANNRVRDLNFSLNGLVGFDLHGKTAGVIGTGKIGKILAQIFRGFGMRVLARDSYPDAAWAAAHGIEYTDTQTLERNSDIISLHTPLTRETHHLMRSETIAITKRGVILLNVSRGELIDTTALIAGLKSGHIGGVALDVYEEEEGIFFEDLSSQVLLDDELARLLTFPNVLITAHQAFLTREALTEIARITVVNLQALAGGKAFIEGSVLA